MLFNSYEFLFAFLPITLLVFFYIGTIGHHRIAIAWLVATSLFYYGWWNPAYLGLILGSIFYNYSLGVALSGNMLAIDRHHIKKKSLLIFGIASNLALLGYFKYANFFVDTVNVLADTSYNIDKIILPLAISFFTFQQVAYLVDAYRGETREYNFLHYCLFVCFFPQLIAGPIVHHKEMLPQFARESTYRFNMDHFSIGLTIFLIGLFKKVVLADSLSLHVTPVFDIADSQYQYTLMESWVGALAYSFQLYFDFSGYSDMAIGIGRMFGIQLPQNFNSPYKSNNIIEFWRRWHITLSRFLRDYLYIPLGGNRLGKIRKHINLFVTMLLGGLWHGAGWTFVVWGGLHGVYLIVNHMFISVRKRLVGDLPKEVLINALLARLLTFFFVVIAWVFFRAGSFEQALGILQGMAGRNAVTEEPLSFYFPAIGLIALSFVIVWGFPNAREYMQRHESGEAGKTAAPSSLFDRLKNFEYGAVSVAVISILFLLALMMMQSVQKSEFLYYDF